MKPKLIPVYTGDIDYRWALAAQQFGDYPVAYWGYREVFCKHHQGPLGPLGGEEAPAYEGEEITWAEALTQYLSRFSLFEKLCNGCLDNHSTVKMKSGACITFSDGRVYIGTDVYKESCPEANETPLWTWSEPYPGDGMWMSREDNK